MMPPSPAEIKALLRSRRLSPSAPRVAIYAWLCTHEAHPTVDDIFRALRPEIPTLSRTTVYNVLHAFVEKRLANAVRTEDLELRYDGKVTRHAHFKCTACGALCDIGEIPATLAKRLSVPEGFAAEDVSVTLWGLCKACAEQARTKRATPAGQA